MSNLGSCWSAAPFLTFPSRKASGPRAVAEAIVRRWSTPNGRLIDDGSYGLDLSDLVSADLSPADLAAIGVQASTEAEKDERVISCTTTVMITTGPVGDTMTVAAIVQTAQGPFRLVVNVSEFATVLVEPT